jgi:hypothetical protein
VVGSYPGGLLINLSVGRKNINENKEHIYSHLCLKNELEIQVIQAGTDTIQNSYTSYSSKSNPLYFAKLQSVADPENKTKNNTILEIYANSAQVSISHHKANSKTFRKSQQVPRRCSPE